MFQETVIIGNVTYIGELKYQPNDEAWKMFKVETTRIGKDINGNTKKEKAIWRVHAWERWAEWADKNVKMGMYIQVRGRMSPDEKSGGPVVHFQREKSQYVAYYDLVARDMFPWGGASMEIEHLPIDPQVMEEAE